jgi:hypothetical protein
MSDDRIDRIRKPETFVEVGGPIDETRVTLGIHGDDLDPDELSVLLKCGPSAAHRRGDRRPRNVPPWPSGAWLLSVKGKAPTGPEELLTTLLDRLPQDPSVWDVVRQRFTLRLSCGVFVDAWNRGFDLSPAALKRITALGASFTVNIYAEGSEGDG